LVKKKVCKTPLVDHRVGKYAFIFGVLIALVLGVASHYMGAYFAMWLSSLLVILGLIVGVLNVPVKEIKDFLLYVVVLVIAAGMGSASDTLASVGAIGVLLSGVFTQLLAFVVPAAIIVALKGVLSIVQE